MGLKESQLANAGILPFPHALHGRGPAWPMQQDQHLLHTVLENMTQGVLMFDADARLVFCNRRYMEMYGLPAEAAKPGSSLLDLLKHRLTARTFSGDPDEYIAELLAKIAEGETFHSVVTAGDGRAISILNKPLAGGGWLATHEDVTDRRRAEERIAHMARHDALTDLPNRMLLRERLEHELKRVKRGENLAVLCLDLDHFKSVNDTLGHPIGDELLKLVADRLRGCTREPDTIARLGGDEFAIIMTQMHQPRDAAALSRRIREFDRQAVSGRRPPDHHRHQHRHFNRADRRCRTGSAPEKRRHGAVRRQRRRPRHVPVLRARNGQAHEGAARARNGPAPGAQ